MMTEENAAVDAKTDEVLARLWAKLAQAEACWFSSVRPDGRVHTAPIWHVRHGQTIYVVTQPVSVRARNIARNSSVSIALPDPMNALIVEGIARFAPDKRDAIRPVFQEKYNWDIGSDTDYTTIVAVEPRKMMAWGDHGTGRWHFAVQPGGAPAQRSNRDSIEDDAA